MTEGRGSEVVDPVNANEVLTLKLGDEVFNPTFTYPIYGDKELIDGFKDPELKLEFDPKTLLPLLEYSFGEQLFDDAEDPKAKLLEFLPPDTHTNRAEWEAAVEVEKKEFQIPGHPVVEIDDKHTVYKTTIKQGLKLLRRMRLFVLLFIEAGSYIDEEDESWELYLLFENQNEHLVGFATVYPYFYYQDGASFDTEERERPIRMRISQFIIFPPYQKRGLGTKFYEALVNLFTDEPRVKEITVEDPNEAFDDMRDRGDLQRLGKLQKWTELNIPLDEETLDALASELKMVPRQVRRCLEMEILKKYPKEPKQYREFVKNRLYRQNYEGLKDLDQAQLRETLNSTYTNVVDDYRRLLGLEDAIEEQVVGEAEQPAAKKTKLDGAL